MKQVKYSIIVPIYNVEKYVAECIESVLNQSLGNFELILIDDGSTDSSGLICDGYKEKDNRVKIIHKKNEGRLSTWIAGLKEAKGEYIGSIDGDDYVDNDLLQKIDSIIDKYCPEISVFGYKSVNDFHEVLNKYNINIETGLYDKKKIEEVILPRLINVGSFEERSCIYLSRINKFIKRELLINNMQYYICHVEYGEDNLWTIPNVIKANNIYVMADFYPYNYRQNSTSITHSVNKNLWEKFVALNDYTISMLKDLHADSLIGQVYCDSVFHAAVSINNIIYIKENVSEKRKKIRDIVDSEYLSKGIPLMDNALLSKKEKLNLFLMKNKLVRMLLIIKSLQNKVKKNKLYN